MLLSIKYGVNAIHKFAYPTPAKRPRYLVLDTIKLETQFCIYITSWRDSLERGMQVM